MSKNRIHFDQFAAIDIDSSTFANNLGGINQIFEQVLVDGSQSAGTWTLLLDAGFTGGFSEDLSLGHNQDVAIRELLLQFTNQSGLDLVELFEQRDWDKDNDGFATVSDIDLQLVPC
jgi:hypothetical protein